MRTCTRGRDRDKVLPTHKAKTPLIRQDQEGLVALIHQVKCHRILSGPLILPARGLQLTVEIHVRAFLQDGLRSGLPLTIATTM